MPHHSCAGHIILLLFMLSLWTECVMCGSSFLSPTQKPQRQDRKPPRVGRRALAEFEVPLPSEDNRFMMSAPFHLGLSLNDDEYEEYGTVLQKILLDVLGDSPPSE
ncbi:ghrelin/obestatin prepropeptide [Hoplias malabaricus]|uniref:ghrelin/obestatin prepropeptide n=1 Tax=Hoplias malabaricus TaxID=27720 RepID=UPI003461BA2A